MAWDGMGWHRMAWGGSARDNSSSNETQSTFSKVVLRSPLHHEDSPVNARANADFPDPLPPITPQHSPVRISNA